MALENVAHFNTWCIKKNRKNKSGPEKNWGPQFFNTTGPNGLWNFFGLFWLLLVWFIPEVNFYRRKHEVKTYHCAGPWLGSLICPSFLKECPSKMVKNCVKWSKIGIFYQSKTKVTHQNYGHEWWVLAKALHGLSLWRVILQPHKTSTHWWRYQLVLKLSV